MSDKHFWFLVLTCLLSCFQIRRLYWQILRLRLKIYALPRYKEATRRGKLAAHATLGLSSSGREARLAYELQRLALLKRVTGPLLV